MRLFLFLEFLAISLTSFSQCEIFNRVSPDGSMLYYMKPVPLYRTKDKELNGNLLTDKENYFLGLQPIPSPEKSQLKKLKGNLEIKLSNGKLCHLKSFDTRYLENDTIMELLYLIDKRDMDDMLKFEILQVKIDLKGKEGFRTYNLKLNKATIQEQLACFLKQKTGKMKK
jgi:hypothetical protein